MAAEDHPPLLQLGLRVDSSRVGSHVLSPILSTSSASLSLETKQPICIPSTCTDLSHDFTTIPSYSPANFSYAGPSIPDCPSVHQSLSTSLFGPSHGHVGPPIPLHRSQARPQHSQPIQSPSDGVLTSVRKRSQVSEEGVASSGGKADLPYCAVCDDNASGYHYGVWSCEGCKAFFKRNIHGHSDYLCPATNQCTIDKSRRKNCQACRLRKCYEVGMTKCGNRKDCGNYRNPQTRQVPHLSLQGRANGPKGSTDPAEGSLKETQPPTLTSEQLIKRIMEAEPPEIYLMKDMKRPLTEANVMMSLTDLAHKELVHMVRWAKKIPGFVELSICNQIHLLDCCWLEVLMIGLMWRSVDHPGKLIFSPDLSLTREEGSCVQGFVEMFDTLIAVTSRVRELKLQREEFVCVKAIILFNSYMCLSSSEGSEDIQSRSELLRHLDAIIHALVWAIAKTALTFHQQYTRLAHLLMLLSHIRHASNQYMDHLQCMKMKNTMPLNGLLLEMLDAHIMHSSRVRPSNTWTPSSAGAGGAPHKPSGKKSTFSTHLLNIIPT
uniref:Estrogen receptor 2a n=1 Tax=Acanthochromis polyacanthus TaxID=80966 RepID=A0A3Q1GHC5_9TELE